MASLSLRILVVDDDPRILEALRAALEGDGHLLTTVDGGQAAVDTFLAAETRGIPFDVVITDLGLPNVGGRTVAATVKRIRAATPVVLLTGSAAHLVKEGHLPAHVDRMLTKPPRLSELRAVLQELTGIAKA
jgi:CheY-like chemotaxis protein